MKRIKDFLYNWNDIVLILGILLAAAAVIYWRVNAIMDYPKDLAKEIQATGTAQGLDIDMTEAEASDADGDETEGADGDSENKDDADDEKDDADADSKAESKDQDKGDGDSEDAESKDGEAETDSDSDADTDSEDSSNEPVDISANWDPGMGPLNNDIWQGGVLSRDVTVTTYQGDAQTAAGQLIYAGLFSSYDDYYAICVNNGIDPTTIKAGDFTFPAGSSQFDIAFTVTR